MGGQDRMANEEGVESNLGPTGRIWLLAAAAAVAATLLYAPTLTSSFLNWDDNVYVYDNPHLGQFDWQFVKWAFTNTYQKHWSPFLWLSLGFDHALWGFNPLGYHLSNIVLHGTNIFLVVLLSNGLLGHVRPDGKDNRWAAAAAGLLFGVHPLHVEAVAWVTSRKDLLYSVFYLASLLAYVRYVASAGYRRGWLYVLSVLAFLLSLMSKPMAVSLPAIILILDLYPFRRIKSASALVSIGLLEKLPFYLAGLVSSLMTYTSWKHSTTELAEKLLNETFPLASRVWIAFHSIIYYAGKTLLPTDLSAYHPMPTGSEAAHVAAPVALAVFLLVTCAVLVLIRRAPGLAVAWACYLIMIFPTLGIPHVFGVTTVADRFVYLALLALILPAVCGAGMVLKRSAGWRKTGVASLCILVLLTLTAMSVRQIGYWRDPVAFWDRIVAQNPGDFRATSNLGEAYNAVLDFDKAALCFSKAIAMNGYWPPAYYGLGVALSGLGREEEALGNLDKTIGLQQVIYSMERSTSSMSNLAFYYRARFQALGRLRRYQEAVEDFSRAAELSDTTPSTDILQGRRLAGEGQFEGAFMIFERSLAGVSP